MWDGPALINCSKKGKGSILNWACQHQCSTSNKAGTSPDPGVKKVCGGTPR